MKNLNSTIMAQTKILIGLIYSIIGLVSTSTITLVTDKKVFDLFCFILFLFFGLLVFYWSMTSEGIKVSFLGEERELLIYFGLGVNEILNNLFLII